MNNFYYSTLLDSHLSWNNLLDLDKKSEQLNKKIQTLLNNVEPLELETYDRFFLKEKDSYVVNLTDWRLSYNKSSGYTNKLDNNVTVNDTLTYDQNKLTTNDEGSDEADNTSTLGSGSDKSSDDDSSDDDETFTQKRNRLETTMETARQHRTRFSRHKRSCRHSKKKIPLRQSFRLILQRQQPELNTIRKDYKKFSIPKLPESTIKTVRKPYRKSDTLLPKAKRFKPEQDYPIIPLFQKIPLRTLLTMNKFKQMLNNLPDYD